MIFGPVPPPVLSGGDIYQCVTDASSFGNPGPIPGAFEPAPPKMQIRSEALAF